MRSLPFLCAAVLLLIANSALAQGASCPPDPPTVDSLDAGQLQRDVRDRGLLWRLEKDGRVSWLYGSVHVSKPEWLVPGPRVQGEADERELLVRGLSDLETGEGRVSLGRLLQAWAAGDEERLASYPQWCKCLETPAERRFFQRVNDERNRAMARRLDTLHAGRSVFAAVGALHMTGPDALPLLMRQRGFQVQRIPF